MSIPAFEPQKLQASLIVLITAHSILEKYDWTNKQSRHPETDELVDTVSAIDDKGFLTSHNESTAVAFTLFGTLARAYSECEEKYDLNKLSLNELCRILAGPLKTPLIPKSGNEAIKLLDNYNKKISTKEEALKLFNDVISEVKRMHSKYTRFQ